ncbi:hypothetical protein N7520_008560 [Penicillium odoratum]|uniref:uncharacterized protein n=1 Tax=Penicillium odoratum TaxID=1167516 RepID=UPI002548EE21|nr:uncharacterized protein N7520_008560 [Penicillium odoratum]KAJ5751643.1 hypothetical protein N7520_008560 [Penicillium odoratum]
MLIQQTILARRAAVQAHQMFAAMVRTIVAAAILKRLVTIAPIHIYLRSDYASAKKYLLDVCCSEYGYCGTSSSFCGNTTWSSPEYSGTSASTRRIGYYEGWNLNHACDSELEPS